MVTCIVKIVSDTLDYELITWSKDQSLRIWRIEPFLQKVFKYDDICEYEFLILLLCYIISTCE